MERIHVLTSSNANSGFSPPPVSDAPQKAEHDISSESLGIFHVPFVGARNRRLRHSKKRTDPSQTEAGSGGEENPDSFAVLDEIS